MTETDEQRNARWDRQRPVIAAMLESACFGHEVCKYPPCACAQAVIDAAEKIGHQQQPNTEAK